MNRLNDYKSAVEKRLFELASVGELNRSLTEAMAYSLEAGGKRIRPVLAMEFCRVCGGNPYDALDAACAVEITHTFSLIHDDLPCMDDDDLRRGKPSCHKKFGEDTALLAGDALSIKSYEVIASCNTVPQDRLLRCVAELARAAGADGMCAGQVLDLENESREVSTERLGITHKLKTGELISASCKIGAIIAGADEEKISLASEYGYKLGLAFQIVDDILDIEGSTEELGKPVGSDSLQNKTTYITLLGMDNAKKLAEKITNEAMDILNNFNDCDALKELTRALLHRGK